MQDIIVFGSGKISEAVSWFIDRDKTHRICAYTADPDFIDADSFLGRPLLPLAEVSKKYPANKFLALIAIGYQGMNSVRTEKCEYFKKSGYKLASYISPNVKGNFIYGENCIVMDDAIFQPYVTLGDNVFVWGGAMVGHHAMINDNCWITGSCAIGGLVDLGKNCFVGLNTTIGNQIVIGEKCILGASATITKSLAASSVVVEPDTGVHRLNAEQFSRLSSCFRA